MIQTDIPSLSFIQDISFEVSGTNFKLKSGPLFGKLFGDREYLPLSFKVLVNNLETTLTKLNMENINGTIVVTYVSANSSLVINAYL